jgi:hypothetical protein
MRPDKLSVHQLFQQDRRYIVPLYQRSYVWRQDEQWEPLWEDIERQAEACIAAENNVPRRLHFLGAIVLNVAKIVGSSAPRAEVIDGQQRLTTLQLFLAALRDYANAVKSEHASRISRLTVNEDEKAGSESSFKVWPTNSDRGAFKTVMTAGALAQVLKAFDCKRAEDLPRIGQAYAYFAGVIKKFVEGEDRSTSFGEREQRLFGLLQAMRVGLQLVIIELEEGDDPQVIFETLNARGQPLLPSDLIRNFIFLQAANDPTLNADELYSEYWSSFDNKRLPQVEDGEDRFWHTMERQGRLTRPRIDLFIFHYLVMKTGRDLLIGQLFREFRDWRDEGPTPLEELLRDLRAHSDVFAKLIEPEGNDRTAILSRRLKSLDTSTIYPLLMYVLSLPKDQLAVEGRDQILGDLESWLVRRMVCHLTNKNYNRFFVQLLTVAKQAASAQELPKMIRAELLRSDDVTTNWPSDQEFMRGWSKKSIYVGSRPDRSAMLLRAIEERIRTSKNEHITLPGELTVEHLLPQKGKLADYPYSQSMPLELEETPERCRSRLVNTIGNLTLLTQELNSAISNGPFPAKRAAIAKDSDLRLNAWLRDPDMSTWSEADIEKRANGLMAEALKEWKHPG